MSDLPANAVLFWTDDTSIYAEVPKSDASGFCRLAFPYTSYGLSQALALLSGHRLPARPPSTAPAARTPKGYTPAQAQAALAVLGKIRK